MTNLPPVQELSEELLPCPFCGGTDKLKVTPYMAGDDGGEPFAWGFTVVCNAAGFAHVAGRGCGGSGAWGETEAEASPLAARRSSSDEQAEVAAWMIPGSGSITTDRKTAAVWGKDFGCTVQPLVVASPSGVKAGVTDDVAARVLKARPFGDATIGKYLGLDETSFHSIAIMKRVLVRALGVSDEGMGEGAIRICPERDAPCPHGSACPYNHDRYHCSLAASRANLPTPPIQGDAK